MNILRLFKNFFKCPPHFYLSKLLTLSLCFGLIYLCLYSIDPISSIPGNCRLNINKTGYHRCQGGNFFGLFVLFICALIGGNLVTYLKLPSLLGMLVMGYFLRNIPYLNVAIYIEPLWSGYLRKLALSIILIRAGLNIDPEALKKLSFAVIRLSFIPCLTEAIVGCVIGHYLLLLPWGWSFILGFVLSAVSPAVVIPSILELQKQGLGVDEGVTTLIIAASSIDDILAISGFSIALSFTFASNENYYLNIFRGPFEALAGISYGILVGLILWFLPSGDNDKFMLYRSVILFLSSLGAMFGCTTFYIPGAGPLAVLTLSFVTSIGWRRDPSWKDADNPLIETTEIFWSILQPFLFGLIGAGLDNSSLDFKYLGFGILTIIIALACRLTSSFVSMFCTSFDNKEKAFIAIAWLPKATVQAALGPIALDFVMKNSKPKELVKFGELILAIAVISIMLTAPLGASLISLTAPYLLKKSSRRDVTCHEMEFKTATEKSQRLFNESSF